MRKPIKLADHFERHTPSAPNPHTRRLAGGVHMKQATVLVVEDQENERRMLTQVLKTMGFRVKSTTDTEGAMRYAEEGIDVVLTDLHMGAQSGIDLISRWRSLNSHTVFVFITGDREPLTAVEVMKQGAFDYLTKPVDPSRLEEVVHKAIQNAA